MWVAIAIIFIAIAFVFWRIIWAIFKPIFIFVYESIVNALMSTGITEQAAKAIVSVVAILIILWILF